MTSGTVTQPMTYVPSEIADEVEDLIETCDYCSRTAIATTVVAERLDSADEMADLCIEHIVLARRFDNAYFYSAAARRGCFGE